MRREIRGLTMVEMLAAMVLSALCALTLVHVTNVKINAQTDIDSEAEMITVDAFFSDVYRSFKRCTVVDVIQSAPNEYMTMTFSGSDMSSTMYTYDPATGVLSKNNVTQFLCDTVTVSYVGNNLYLAVKIKDDRLIELSMFK